MSILNSAKRLYDFIDGNIELENSSFDIGAIVGTRWAAVMAVVNYSDGERSILLETIIDPREGQVAEVIHQWYSCLQWMKTLTGCILTIEEMEELDKQ